MAGTAIWTGPNAAQVDGNQNPTTMMVAGTLGTADTKGTAAPIRWGGNPLTNAGYVEVIGTVTTTGGAGGGTTVTVDHGSIVITSGTITSNAPQSLISTNNSTSGTLGANAVYTGTFEDVTTYSEMRASVFTSHNSATDGLVFQQSSDGTNADVTDTYSIGSNTGKTFVVPRQAKFFRVVYTNGGTAQTSFRLQSILNRTATSPSSQRSSDAYTNETDLDQVWSFNSLWNGATWDRVKGTSGTAFVAAQAGTINIVQNAGTLQVGANIIGNVGTLVAGTINSATVVLNSGTINVGTFVNNGGTVAVVQNAGTLATGVNTIGNVGTLIAGTINAATAVLNSGTITTAQINPKPVTNPILNAGVTGTTGIGTLITAAAVGAGTSVYVAGYEILVISGTPEVCLAFGTQVTGNQVISHGLFPAGGGVTRKDLPSTYGTTNTALTYQIVSGSGTVSWKVAYWIGV